MENAGAGLFRSAGKYIAFHGEDNMGTFSYHNWLQLEVEELTLHTP